LRTQNLSATHSGGRRCQDGPQRSEEYLDSTSRPTAVIFRVRLAGSSFQDLDGLQLHHPRPVLQLLARVDRGIVRRLVADHRGDDFESAHSQAAQRAGVTLAFLTMRLVIDACPVTIMAAEVNPQMNGGSQEPIALIAQIDHRHFTCQEI